MKKVAVLGAKGRMGSAVVAAVNEASDLELVAALDLGDDRGQIVQRGAQVVVDFTTPTSVMSNIEFCISHDIDVVVGTSGLQSDDLNSISGWLTGKQSAVFVAPNFGIAAVLMMQFAATAAPFFESVEVIELHHPDKLDAPSGTARRTAEMIGEARGNADCAPMPDATREEDHQARGVEVAGVPVHSVRLRGLIAHQEVLLGSAGETLIIRHDSMNRESFMPGVLLAVRKVSTTTGLTVGLEHILEQ